MKRLSDTLAPSTVGVVHRIVAGIFKFSLLAEPVEHRLVQLVEQARVGPLKGAAPAGPARAVAQLAGQLGPADAGGEHEGDALQHVPIGSAGPPGAAVYRRLLRWDQRLDQRPQLVIDQPRRRGRHRLRHARTLRRSFADGQSPTTYFRNVF